MNFSCRVEISLGLSLGVPLSEPRTRLHGQRMLCRQLPARPSPSSRRAGPAARVGTHVALGRPHLHLPLSGIGRLFPSPAEYSLSGVSVSTRFFVVSRFELGSNMRRRMGFRSDTGRRPASAAHQPCGSRQIILSLSLLICQTRRMFPVSPYVGG